MSGPKCGSWRVVYGGGGYSARECQRILRHYLECILQFRDRLEALQRRHPELQINTYTDELPSGAPAAVEAIVAELNNRYRIYIRLRDELARVESLIALRERMRPVAAMLDGERATAAQAAPEASLAQRARQALEALDARAAPDLRAGFEDRAKACLDAGDPAAAALLLTDLRARIAGENRQIRAAQQQLAERRDRDAADARDWLQRLDRIGATPDSRLQDCLMRVASGEACFGDEVRERAAAFLRQSERSYAGTVLKETLQELGYTPQEGFETLFAEGGANFFQRRAWGPYHVRVSVDPARRQRLNFDVVRAAGPGESATAQKLRDQDMEQTWCGEVAEVLDTLARRGLAVDLTRRLPAGMVELQEIDAERLGSTQSATSGAGAVRGRSATR